MRPLWRTGPSTITLVRHGESIGNLADTRAREAAAEVLDLDDRDADVSLSPRGREQAGAIAAWLERADHAGSLPDVVISSPYRRAAETAQRALARTQLTITYDERLRERDLGLFDGLTGRGIRARYPEEAERRKRLGKFYYQPPSGESWCDVVLRLRTLLRDLESLDGAHVWLVTHQAVIMSARFVLEELTEQAVLDIDRTTPVPNASLTVYGRVDDVFVLRQFGDATLIENLAAPVTHERDPRQRTEETTP
jgi:broad specificity phosphatase PhoE